MKLITAPWVLPVIGPPLERGAVLVHGGEILAVGGEAELKSGLTGVEVEEAPDALLLPGFVNAHAHLELSALGPVPGGLDFSGWIKEIIRLKRSARPEDFAAGAATGSAAALKFGQTTVADVVSSPLAALAPKASGQRVLNLAEVIAASDEAAEAAVRGALEMLRHSALPGGLFPHTPFTVGGAGFRLAAAESVARFGRYFTHLAESPDEVEFCLAGTGPVAERIYAGLPVKPPTHPGLHPFDFLDSLGLVHSGAVFVHCVHLRDSHIQRMAEAGAAAVLCPRSNRTLGVGRARATKMLAAGVSVGLGTDSVLSCGDLDMVKEIRATVEECGLTPAQAFHAATAGSAAALGLSGSVGALKAGMRADILALTLGAGNSPEERALDSGAVAGVWAAGERVA